MKGQWREIQITDINFKAQIQDLNYEKRFSSTKLYWKREGGGGVALVPTFFLFFLLQQSEEILRLGMCERLTS